MQQIKKRRGFFSIISPFLIYYAVSFVVEFFAMVVLMIPKMPEIEKLPAEEVSQYMMEQCVPYLIEECLKYLGIITIVAAACVIPVFLIQYHNDKKYEKMLGIPERKKEAIWKYVIIIGLAVSAGIGSTNILTLSNISAYSAAYQETSNTLYSVSFGVQMLGYGLLVPIAEEMMFRGLVYKRLMFMSGKKSAMLLSALVFGLYHANLVQGIYGFVIGYIAAYIYEKYGSMKAPILLHAAANITSVIATEYHLFNWIFQDAVRVGVITVLCAAVASSMFVLVQRVCSDKENESEKEQDVPSV